MTIPPAGHGLIRAASVPGRLSLVQILKQGHPPTTAAHSHTAVTHLLPAQCKVLGRSRWFYCGLIQPSIVWRVQGLLLAAEVKTSLSVDTLRMIPCAPHTMEQLMRSYTTSTSAEKGRHLLESTCREAISTSGGGQGSPTVRKDIELPTVSVVHKYRLGPQNGARSSASCFCCGQCQHM